ncbi:MAG: hypothetical protein HUU23_12530 [Caldilineales bacterium]|nr:hypothetical protein [Caldilineales bacterium]
MLLGIGYLPQRTGPGLWRDFDPAEIADDLAHIAALGFQAVRVPLFWGDFQPALDQVHTPALDRFERFLRLSEEAGLTVEAGLWAGMWDGALWWPEWGVTPAPLPPHWPLLVDHRRLRWGRVRHPFSDERMLAARGLLIQELVATFGGHPALLGWEPLPGFGRLAAAVERSAVRDWQADSVERMRAASPGCDCTFLLALEALESPNTLWPDAVLAAGGQPSLSIAAFASDRRRLPLNPRWIAFALDVAAGLAGQPISMHLAGLPTAPPGEPSFALHGSYYAHEEEAGRFLAAVIAIARDRGCPRLWLWRWADIPAAHWEQPPYDQATWRRHTGLLRQNGQEKALIQGLRATSADPLPSPILFDRDAYRADPAALFLRLWRDAQQT